ncbi:MAG TPA: aminoglycoside 6-adenylyltransferase [Anaerolineaceae bacterium]
MRSEQEMLDLILGTAQTDERIRAVILNGSRANPNTPRDFFQDFDVVYLVTDPGPFKNNYAWIRRFGELMILQEPDDMLGEEPRPGGAFAYLMQFTDGNRIDLTIFPAALRDQLEDDSQTRVLLDKDGLFPNIPPASDHDYLPQPPSARAFAECCNEFWWVCPYAAKGLWRGEFPYARHILEEYARAQLMKMLTWYVGVQTGFSRSPGKLGKYLQHYLPAELWSLLLQTCTDSDYESTWDALFAMGRLFRAAAAEVAAHFGYAYPLEDDRRVTAHLEHVRHLPKDAKEMY